MLLFAAIGWSKSPADSATVCDRYKSSDLIFTGTTEHAWIDMVETRQSPVHKRSEKAKRVRFLSRDWYKGTRQNFVEVWMTPGDCPLHVQAGETYLIYARINKDKRRVESNGCMGMTAVSAAASDLSYLTATQLGPDHATRVSGNAGGPGLNVLAKSGINTRYAVSDGSGQYVFDGLTPGEWVISVSGGPAKQVQVEPSACIAP